MFPKGSDQKNPAPRILIFWITQKSLGSVFSFLCQDSTGLMCIQGLQHAYRCVHARAALIFCETMCAMFCTCRGIPNSEENTTPTCRTPYVNQNTVSLQSISQTWDTVAHKLPKFTYGYCATQKNSKTQQTEMQFSLSIMPFIKIGLSTQGILNKTYLLKMQCQILVHRKQHS